MKLKYGARLKRGLEDAALRFSATSNEAKLTLGGSW